MPDNIIPSDADYTAYDRLAAGRTGTTVNGTAQGNLNTRMADLCTAMKAKGIIIYTIVVEVPSPSTQALYSGCATKPAFAFIAPAASGSHGDFPRDRDAAHQSAPGALRFSEI